MTRRKAQFYALTVPAVSREFAKVLNATFPALTIKPGVTADEMQYNAGQRAVVEWVLRQASGTIVSGDVNDLRKETEHVSVLSRILGILNIRDNNDSK